MAKLVIVTHEYDIFAYRRAVEPSKLDSAYLLFDVLRHLDTLGHSCRVTRGAKPVEGDVAFLHVDATVVDEEYLSLSSCYEQTINFGTGDISKRKISQLLLSKGDSWEGPVIVKSDINNRAIVEDLHNQRALQLGQPPPHPGIAKSGPYRVFDHLADVDDQIWADPTLVVEKFVPEADADGGFVLRTWVFMGPRERCTRMVTSDSISKAADVIHYEPIEVPQQLRAERERLNFDFGKFDFVMHEGVPILLDANRTPGVARAIQPLMKAGARNLAEGLDYLITHGE